MGQSTTDPSPPLNNPLPQSQTSVWVSHIPGPVVLVFVPRLCNAERHQNVVYLLRNLLILQLSYCAALDKNVKHVS
jgi:hypothetical protein